MPLKGFGKAVFDFNTKILTPQISELNFEFINPFESDLIVRIQKEFCSRYYHGQGKRIGIFGINPGRLGAGITGIPFTDPKNLKAMCRIDSLPLDSGELSSEFVYSLIHRWGGVVPFYQKFYVGSVCPMGLLSRSRNANYYDSPELIKTLRPWIAECMKAQISMGLRKDLAIVLGAGKNAKFFTALNDEFSFFKTIQVLEHPRYIMQYKRKDMSVYLDTYLALLRSL